MMGADVTILNQCKASTRFSFTLAGIVVSVFLLVTFIASFYLLHFVTDNLFIDFLVALLLTFTVINLYRFSISNLGWMADGHAWEKNPNFRELDPPDIKSSVAKLFFLSLLFMFISKPFELLLFHYFIKEYTTSYQAEKSALVSLMWRIYSIANE